MAAFRDGMQEKTKSGPEYMVTASTKRLCKEMFSKSIVVSFLFTFSWDTLLQLIIYRLTPEKSKRFSRGEKNISA